jgi:adenosylcobinamide amidohydrolase
MLAATLCSKSLPQQEEFSNVIESAFWEMNDRPNWKSSLWFDAPTFSAYRQGRFLIAELNTAHQVITTSACAGGLSTTVRYLVNHQSCEATDHKQRYLEINVLGPDGYHRSVCDDLTIDPQSAAVMGTAANMIYAAHETQSFEDVRVDAVVTAGVESNATCAGDPAQWIETVDGWNKLQDVAGTINTIVVINQPVMPEALVRTLLTITEGKTAALTELGISSRYSQDLATGTGTDQVCVAAPFFEDRHAYRSASPHTKLGELLGLAARAATRNALRWQNGLEPSLTRSLVHGLRRFGFSEHSFILEMRRRLDETSAGLIEKNKNAVLYEPQVAAAGYAFAAVLDRMRFGVVPASAAAEILRQQAALIAATLAAQTEHWHAFWGQLELHPERPLDAVYDALALGWAAKWQQRY